MPNPDEALACRDFSFHLTIESPHLNSLFSEASPEACHGPGTAWETGAVILGLGNCFDNTEQGSQAVQDYQKQVESAREQ